MILRELLRELRLIAQAHPEAKDAEVVSVADDGSMFYVNYIGFDKGRKRPLRVPRIKLEQ